MTLYYIAINQKQQGPFTIEELKRMNLPTQTLVWYKGLKNWIPISNVKELSEDTGVEVAYYSSSKGQISIDYDKDSLVNSKVNFSRYSDLKEKINEGITYDNFISYIGGVEGTLIEKSSYSTKYVWVSSDGSYLNGTFSSSSGKCTFASGMIK